ncbi:hypothetical protein ACFVJS_03910 [Nocardioides sp. NPDC057772]|uniref:hypothetical protein n=1 Tax=Nocardioides sp. NPDC057772 TaxID=3346245 RepID=UPI0036735299
MSEPKDQEAGPMSVDQTIFVTDPKRKGNCVAACIATLLGIELEVLEVLAVRPLSFFEHNPTPATEGDQ